MKGSLLSNVKEEISLFSESQIVYTFKSIFF